MESSEATENRVSETQVIDFLSERLGLPKEKIQRSSRFVEDFGADSLTMMELVVSFEERFNVAIDDETTGRKPRTVGEVLDLLQARQS